MHRTLQLFVMIFLIDQIVQDGSWAHTETPLGTVNAYASGTSSATAAPYVDAIDAFRKGNVPSYCGNSSYASAAYPPPYFWQYETPQCEVYDWQTISQKDPTGAVFIDTTIIEQNHFGWACSDGVPEWAASCMSGESGSGGEDSRQGNQCKCVSTRTVVPVGAEFIGVGFGYKFKTPTKTIADGGLSGSSSRPYTLRDHDNPINTCGRNWGNDEVEDAYPYECRFRRRQLFFNFTEGDKTTWKVMKNDLSGTIHDSLVEAGFPLGLDTPNPNLPRDHLTKQPITLRTGGFKMTYRIDYKNRAADNDGVLLAANPQPDLAVVADVRVVPDLSNYGGRGQTSTFIRYPTGPADASTFHTVTRYAQGVVIDFETVGVIHWPEFNAILNRIIAIMVLLSAIGSFTRFIALNMIPNVSVMLRNQAQEVAEQRRQMAMIGSRMMLAGVNFKGLDADMSGALTAVDLIKVLAKTDSMSFEKAYAISHTIMKTADVKGTGNLDFSEYFSAMEPILSFDKYVQATKDVDNLESQVDYAMMKKAFDEVQTGEEIKQLRARRLQKQKTGGVVIA